MKKITSISIKGQNRPVYESDIVDYISVSDDTSERCVGVIVYDKEKFLFGIQSVDDSTITPLFQAKILNILGNLYDHPEYLGWTLETIYRKKGIDMPELPEEHTKASGSKAESAYLKNFDILTGKMTESEDGVDLYIGTLTCEDRAFWAYSVESDGHITELSGRFLEKDSETYCESMAVLIALSHIKKPDRMIRIHIASRPAETALDYDFLTRHQKDLSHYQEVGIGITRILEEIRKNIDRIGRDHIRVEYHPVNDFMCKLKFAA